MHNMGVLNHKNAVSKQKYNYTIPTYNGLHMFSPIGIYDNFYRSYSAQCTNGVIIIMFHVGDATGKKVA